MSLSQVAHRFVRNANFNSSVSNRMANRSKPMENTLVHLKDPATGREVYLVGSTHASDLLAARTQQLIQQVKPDQVYLQTNQKWVDTMSQLSHVQGQESLNNYNLHLAATNDFSIPKTLRGLMFRLRLYPWLAVTHLIKAFSKDFHPFIPGQEMYQAYNAANQVNAKVVLGGQAMDQQTVDRLFHEKRMDLLPLLWRLYNTRSTYNSEKFDHYSVLKNVGGQGFGESMDRYRANWFASYFSMVAPYQKNILVDQKDLDIFHALHSSSAKTTVAVVNQWHMAGVENHWRHSTGTMVHQPINPVGDMDLNALAEDQIVNDFLRNLYAQVTKSEPASYTDYITQYHSETHEQERNRAVKYYNHQDPQQHSALPYDSLGSHTAPRHKPYDVKAQLQKVKANK